MLVVADELIVVSLQVERLKLGGIGHDFSELMHLRALVVIIDLVLSLARVSCYLHGKLVALVMNASLIENVEVVRHRGAQVLIRHSDLDESNG